MLDEKTIARALRLGEAINAALKGRLKPSDDVIVALLLKAQRCAIEAMGRLAETEPGDLLAIRQEQNEVHRYRDLVTWITQFRADYDEAMDVVDEADRDAIRDLTNPSYDPDDEAENEDA
jgi:hypothetical protein